MSFSVQLYPNNAKEYRGLVRAWIHWAIQNEIPLDTHVDGLDSLSPIDSGKSVDIPYSRRYFAMAQIERNHATLPTGHFTSALSPESDFDRHESALWLEDLLRVIHGEVR